MGRNRLPPASIRCDAASVRKSKSARTAFWSASSTSSSRARSSASSAASGASSPGTPALVIASSLTGSLGTALLPTEDRRGVQEAVDEAGEHTEQQREQGRCGD